jgi:hypothetical protein
MSEGNGKVTGHGSCGTCEWSHKDALMKDTTLYCRRHPPTAVFMGMTLRTVPHQGDRGDRQRSRVCP